MGNIKRCIALLEANIALFKGFAQKHKNYAINSDVSGLSLQLLNLEKQLNIDLYEQTNFKDNRLKVVSFKIHKNDFKIKDNSRP